MPHQSLPTLKRRLLQCAKLMPTFYLQPAHAASASAQPSNALLQTELYRYIGDETDVPAGDIGVGGPWEIGLLKALRRLVLAAGLPPRACRASPTAAPSWKGTLERWSACGVLGQHVVCCTMWRAAT